MINLDQLIYDPSTNSGARVGAHIVDAAGHALDINADGSINVNMGTVTDLDIRNLVFATDKVDVTGSTVALNSTSLAALENITAVVSGPVELGATTLAALESITVTATDLDIRNLSFTQDKIIAVETNNAIKNSAVSITTTAAQLTPTPLSNRKSLIVQNLGSKEIFVGDSAVTSSNGVKIAAGANAELKYDATVALYARTATGTADVRILEAANS